MDHDKKVFDRVAGGTKMCVKIAERRTYGKRQVVIGVHEMQENRVVEVADKPYVIADVIAALMATWTVKNHFNPLCHWHDKVPPEALVVRVMLVDSRPITALIAISVVRKM